MVELTIEQKKQAVTKGLSPFLPDTVLQRVLQYWESEYGHQPSFVLNRFLSEICTTHELRLLRKDMLRQLLHEISIVEKQQHLEVKEDLEVVIVEEEQPVDLFQAFYDFIITILKSVHRNDYLEFVDELRVKMKKHRLLAAYRFIDGSEKNCLEQIPQTLYAELITIFYAIYCDFYGPNKADQLYAQIKNTVKQQYPEIDLKQLL
ncbi:hypothetical protein MMO39_15525 [Acinetobacter modestus]|uniref:hypothetical protein n=1 Tax=Acinetobacter modestus TaxID=1776740 RepID=UPI001F4ACEBE|nr:hypothetical protein [Acinetobacter modestus]MCH7388694.1 hypothetical protein [Acinetobacter modestus]